MSVLDEPGGRAVAPAGTGLPRLRPVHDSLWMTWRSLRREARSIDAVLIGIFLPVLLMVMFTYVFGGAIETGEAYIDFVVPSVILLCAGYGAGSTAVSVTQDMTEGIVDRFRTMRVFGASVLAGHVAASVLRNLFSTAVVVLVALALGFRPSAGVAEWLGVLGLLALFILALSWFSAAFGMVARSVEAASALSFFILFLPYVSSAFVPLHTLPDWLRPIAEHQPFTPVIETLRGLLLGAGAGTQWWVALLWCAGLLLVSVIAASLLWRRPRQ